MTPEIRTEADYVAHYAEAMQHPAAYWERIGQSFHWFTPWNNVLSGGFETVDFRWYDGATTNLAYNCLDRHLPALGSKPAIVWESNNPSEASVTLTYAQLHYEVCRFAHVLQRMGIEPGDRVCIYMPMVPEAVIAMLACARMGAVHSVVFGGFSASALSDRINDSRCKLLLTADGTYRGSKEVMLKAIADEALHHTPSIEKVLVLRRTGGTIAMHVGRDFWWDDELGKLPAEVDSYAPAQVDSEHPLFILYTSGSTGRPKGILHTTGGYMVWAGFTFRNVFQIQPTDLFWCTADIGWITGHTYLTYGPLLNGATTLLFEGIPSYPDHSRFWDVVDKHRVTILYTAPTAIRALQAAGNEWLEGKDLSSLRILGSVGEPINEEAWHWYHSHVGKSRCPIVDTWWQTETGGILISAFAGVTQDIPTFATKPMPGVLPVLLNDRGEEIKDLEAEGNLCIRAPWPGIARTTFGDHERFRSTYFTTYPGYYFTGDGARRDEQSNYRITGRVDDVINVSGHRIGTAEVEDALNEHPAIVESAVVGYPHEIKGQGIFAFVILDSEHASVHNLETEVKELVNKLIGPFARPDRLLVVRGLPKTRSGKIMRRILRKIAEGETSNLGDTSTLLDPSVVEEIKQAAATAK